MLKPLQTLFLVVLSWGVGLIPVPTWAAEFPVGTMKELEKAVAAAVPGDVIVMAEGRWENAQILFRANGTAEQPVTLRARTPGKVILCGQSSLRFIGSHLVVDGLLFTEGFLSSGEVIVFRNDSDEEASDCRLTNTAIVDYNPPRETESSTKWVGLYGARNRVDHCAFKGKNNRDQMLTVWLNGQPNHHRIDRNYFGDRPLLGKNGGEIIRVGDSKTSMQISRTLVEENYFENCDGEAEIVSNKSCENIYRRNTFVKSAGALTLRHGNNCVVEGNYFLGGGKAGTGGVRIIGEGHRVVNNYFADLEGEEFFSALGFMACIENSEPSGYLQIKKAVVAFNTVVNCRSSLYLGIGFGSRKRLLPVLDSLIANNVISNPLYPLITIRVEPVNTSWPGNFFHGKLGNSPKGQELVSGDPLLQKGEGGLWLPAESSPVKGSAQGDFPEVMTDILGRKRGIPKDPGCFALGSADPVLHPALTEDQVGPGWWPRKALP